MTTTENLIPAGPVLNAHLKPIRLALVKALRDAGYTKNCNVYTSPSGERATILGQGNGLILNANRRHYVGSVADVAALFA